MKKISLKAVVQTIFRVPLRILWVFPIKQNRIVFQSFNGNDYSDSCKALADYIHRAYPGQYDMYWVTTDSSLLKLPDYVELHSVSKNTVRYFYICLTAKVAICNINQESRMPLKKSQKLINTWHGMPYKTVGLARAKDNKIVDYNVYNLFLSPCKFYTDQVIRHSFQYTGEVLECGLPRNDILFSQDKEKIKDKVYKNFQIDSEVKTVLFAPTFRGDFKNVNTKLNFNYVIDSLQKRFGGKWKLLYREHPMLSCRNGEIEGAINVTFYPDMMELLAVSDVLITDYSSSIWDFALTGKPVFLYTPDLSDYQVDRGVYVDMENLPFKLGHDNRELCEKILNFDFERYNIELKDYFDQMGSFEKGNACEAVTKIIRKWCI